LETPLPLSDDVICERPPITGRDISDLERRMFALPYRFGGLAIRNPIITAEEEYAASKIITEALTKAIMNRRISAP
jgi:hypothetical protein